MFNGYTWILENPIDPQLIKKYKESMELADSLESYTSIAKIKHFRKGKDLKINKSLEYSKGRFEIKSIYNNCSSYCYAEICDLKFCKCLIF